MAPEWRVEKSRSGEFTAYLNGKALHSRFDPVKEAEKVAANIPSDTGIVVLAGLGLGYVAEAILKQWPGKSLIITEADETALDRIAEVRDISHLLQNPKVTLFVGGNPGDIRSFLAGGPVGASIYFLPWQPAIQSNPEWYAKLQEVVKETSSRRAVNANTLERFGNLWIRNLAANRTILPEAISVDAGKNSFTGIPALILAGGPSLEETLPHLKDLSRNLMIFAVDTALQATLRAGIAPDIVAAVDPQYWNTRHLDRCRTGAKEALILAETATHPMVFRKLAGRFMMMRTRFPLGSVLEDAAGLHGKLNAGGSVATAAWDLARHFGCRPIIAAGLDLGFPGRQTHYSGSLVRERPHFFSNRISPAQDIFFHALNDANLHEVQDMAGRPLLTDQRMDVYHSWFTENALKHSDRDPCVLGAQGRQIEGMRMVTLETLLSMRECRGKIERGLEDLRSLPPNPCARRELDRVVSKLTSALNRLKKLALKGIAAADEASLRLRAGQSITMQLTAMSEVDAALISGSGLNIVSFLMQPIILEITSSIADTKTDPIKTSKRLYKEIIESATYHLVYLS